MFFNERGVTRCFDRDVINRLSSMLVENLLKLELVC